MPKAGGASRQRGPRAALCRAGEGRAVFLAARGSGAAPGHGQHSPFLRLHPGESPSPARWGEAAGQTAGDGRVKNTPVAGRPRGARPRGPRGRAAETHPGQGQRCRLRDCTRDEGTGGAFSKSRVRRKKKSCCFSMSVQVLLYQQYAGESKERRAERGGWAFPVCEVPEEQMSLVTDEPPWSQGFRKRLSFGVSQSWDVWPEKP